MRPFSVLKKLAGLTAAVLVALPTAASARSAEAAAAAGPKACVSGHVHHCYSSLKKALRATEDGDEVLLRGGRYAGGIVITTSITLIGAGKHATTIAGGGPVVTVKTTKSHRPRVTIKALSLTGGRGTGNSPTGGHGAGWTWKSFGGGLLVAAAPGLTLGADVTLRHVEVSDSTAVPSRTEPATNQAGEVLGYLSEAYGGGIAAFGNLHLIHSAVVHNYLTEDAALSVGGGIFMGAGRLTLDHSKVSHNTVAPTWIDDPYAVAALCAGICAADGGARITASRVEANSIEANHAPAPYTGQLDAVGAGISQTADDAPMSVVDSSVSRNRIEVRDSAALVNNVWDAGVSTGTGKLTVRRSHIDRNAITATVPSTADNGPLGPVALDIPGDGLIADSTVSGNTIDVHATGGPASAFGAVLAIDATGEGKVDVRDSTLDDNVVTSTSNTNNALAMGAAVFDLGAVTMSRTTLSGNVATAHGPSETAYGGAVMAAAWFADLPAPTLRLAGVAIYGNSAIAPHAHGGGVYTDAPLDADGATSVTGNSPDDVYVLPGGPAVGMTAYHRTVGVGRLAWTTR